MHSIVKFCRNCLLVVRPHEACSLSSFSLVRTRHVRNFMDIWCLCLMSFFIFLKGMLRFLGACIDCFWMESLTVVVMVIRGLTIRPIVSFELLRLIFMLPHIQWVGKSM